MNTKKLITVALILVTPLITSVANAIPSPFYSSMITKMEIDPKFNLGSFQSGYMQLNTIDHTLTLKLVYLQNCKVGGFCSRMIREPLEIQLPITHTERTQCGGITYHAEVDRRISDGALQMIDITDNSLGVCPNNSGLSPTEAIYTTTSLRGFHTLSRFFGSNLKEITAVP